MKIFASPAIDRHHNAVARIVRISILAVLSSVSFLPASAEQLKPETAAAFDHYVTISERQSVLNPFLHTDGLPSTQRAAAFARLKSGDVLIDRAETLADGRRISTPGGLIHHWIGTIYIPGATLTQTLALLQDYNGQYRFYAPDVERSKLLDHQGDRFKVFLRLRKTKLVTVILNTEYDVKYSRLDADRATSVSYSTRIAEVENAGKPNETEKPVGDDSGFLWRLNSYWRFQQRDGGVYVQLEAISLTRDIPSGLAWLVGPFVTGIPKESLEFTLTRTREALQNVVRK